MFPKLLLLLAMVVKVNLRCRRVVHTVTDIVTLWFTRFLDNLYAGGVISARVFSFLFDYQGGDSWCAILAAHISLRTLKLV